MLSSQSIQSIFSSWDVIKNIPDFQELFSNQLSEKLADSNVAEWFSGPANPHHLVFVKMIDLIVHLLGPDLDVIMEELTSQGRRHYRYHSDMIGFFHVDVFAEISVAFVEIIRTLLLEQASKEATTNETEISEDSVLHPGQLETVTKSWTDFFTMIRAIMKQGVKIEVKRHKRRAEKQRQEIIAKQERQSSESTKSMSDTSSDNGSDFASPVSRAPKTKIGRGNKGLSPTRRGIGRAFSSGLEAMRSPPGRSTSGIRMRAGMSLLNGGSSTNPSSSSSNNNNNNNNNKGSKLAALKELSSPTTANKTPKTPLRRGIRSSLSMKKISTRS